MLPNPVNLPLTHTDAVALLRMKVAEPTKVPVFPNWHVVVIVPIPVMPQNWNSYPCACAVEAATNNDVLSTPDTASDRIPFI
jgi:hypothetical protein